MAVVVPAMDQGLVPKEVATLLSCCSFDEVFLRGSGKAYFLIFLLDFVRAYSLVFFFVLKNISIVFGSSTEPGLT